MKNIKETADHEHRSFLHVLEQDWYVYIVPGLDSGWSHLKTVRQTLNDIILPLQEVMPFGDGEDEDPDEYDAMVLDEASTFVTEWGAAKFLASQYGWEGDFAEEPRVMWLPGPSGEFTYGFAIKQQTQGLTFIVLPKEMPEMKQVKGRMT